MSVTKYRKKAKELSKPAKLEMKKPPESRKTIRAYKGVDLFEEDMKAKYGRDFSNKLDKKERTTYSKLLG